MIIVSVDGTREERWYGRPVTVDEVCNVVGGPYRIVCQVKVNGVACYAVERTDGYAQRAVLGQNMAASVMVGKMVWGTVAFVVRGVEMS